MTMPAGLVKLTSQAPGARRTVRSARSTMAGIVRSAKQMPPAPIVSCPSTPCAERDALVDRPALEPSDADRDEHEVRALERVVEVGGGAEREPLAVLGGLALQHLGDAFQPLGVDVVQHDLVERAALQQRAVDERDPEAAAPDDRELHAGRISAIPAAESSALGRNPRAGVRARQGP